MFEPDYSSYSKEELLDALNSIDRKSYPERVSEIEKQLEIRDKSTKLQVNENENEPEIKKETSLLSQPLDLFGRIFYSIIGALALSLFLKEVTTGVVSGRTANISADDSPVSFWIAVTLGLIISLSAFAKAIFSPSKGKDET
ncbi:MULTISPECIES: hypothetical protein [unclassified Alteromonas]|uniref:hypothetical protein n=1 Tax=unclassified Alteromonas TaxID=2614992 RepID=UPI000509ED31|nr:MULTISPECIES: hypothetical protein [unclassified Alteromonas]